MLGIFTFSCNPILFNFPVLKNSPWRCLSRAVLVGAVLWRISLWNMTFWLFLWSRHWTLLPAHKSILFRNLSLNVLRTQCLLPAPNLCLVSLKVSDRLKNRSSHVAYVLQNAFIPSKRCSCVRYACLIARQCYACLFP